MELTAHILLRDLWKTDIYFALQAILYMPPIKYFGGGDSFVRGKCPNGKKTWH